MKKIFWIVLAILSGPLSSQDLSFSLSVPVSVVYGQDFSPGPGGFFLSGEYASPLEFLPTPLKASIGMEFGVTPIGSQILLPFGVIWDIVQKENWSFLAYGRLNPGLTLTRPRPLILVGAETGLAGGWQPVQGVAMIASLGLRYTACPEYSSLYALYSLWEIPVGLTVRLDL